MDKVGDEVLLLILGSLDWHSLPRARLVCSRWNTVGREPMVTKLIRCVFFLPSFLLS